MDRINDNLFFVKLPQSVELKMQVVYCLIQSKIWRYHRKMLQTVRPKWSADSTPVKRDCVALCMSAGEGRGGECEIALSAFRYISLNTTWEEDTWISRKLPESCEVRPIGNWMTKYNIILIKENSDKRYYKRKTEVSSEKERQKNRCLRNIKVNQTQFIQFR